MKSLNLKLQKGVSLVEGMTAAAVLGLAVTVFVTLQSHQEKDFANLRKFDKAAYAVELMFEELAAVYNPVAAQYGNPSVFEDTTAGTSLKVKGFIQLPDNGDQIIIEGVGGRYEITARTDFDDDNYTTLTLERSDVPDETVNKNMATDATKNASITVVSNAQGSLDPYDLLDLTMFEDDQYVDDKEEENAEVALDLENWGALLKKHLGPARSGDKRLIEVEDIDVGTVKKKQVTITIKQDRVKEKFRRLYLAGS